MLDLSVFDVGLPVLLKGAVATVRYCVVAGVCGLALGTAIALGRFSRRRAVRVLATAFVEPFRNTPLLVQAFLIYFGLAQMGLRLSASMAGMIILTLYGSALFAEAVRGGINSVPKGQLEAAIAVGMRRATAMRRIVFPQMMGYMVPALTNVLIALIKDSAALSVITVPELALAAQRIVGDTFRPYETYIMVAAIYWVLTNGTSVLLKGIHRLILRHRFAAARTGWTRSSPA
jgi:polar amino acid transport system permease protein